MQKTIDMFDTPTWQYTSRMLILTFESGSADAKEKEIAKAELLRMGQLLDQYVDDAILYRSLKDKLAAIANQADDLGFDDGQEES